MKVFVLSNEGKPLMPTTPRRARLWLETKRARVVRRDPFTIRLRFTTANGEVVFAAEVLLRDDISEKMTRRRRFRRNRRARKTRYRQARAANRGRPAGWLPPSLHSKAEATVKAVRFIASLLPVGQINVEVGRFDTHRIQNPDIAHLEYQQGELQGYLLREYVLDRWQRKCAYCDVHDVPLELEHIVPRSRGGSNRISNLTLACEIGEVVKPLEMVHHLRCLARGHYQRFNGLHSEHKCWAPRKVRGFKLYELVKAKDLVGYIAGRREKGAFVVKDANSGQKLLEVTPGKLGRVARPTQGWMITRRPALNSIRKEGGASSPS
jgi:hypothetical protein